MRFQAMNSKSMILFGAILLGVAEAASGQSLSDRKKLPQIVSAKDQVDESSFDDRTDQSDSKTLMPASFNQTALGKNSSGSTAKYHLTSHHSLPSVDYFPAEAGSCDGAGFCASGPSLGACCASSCPSTCEPWWAHQGGLLGEVLYLSPGNSDLIYAVEQTDTTNSASPTGPLGITNVDEAVGYRVGLTKCRSRCSSLNLVYARWDGDTTTSIAANGNNVLQSNLIHPSTDTVGSDSLESSARQLINFQLVDVTYRRIWRADEASAINWSGGLRYGNVEQGLVGQQTVSVATGLTTVNTDIDFDGFGILGGLDGERRSQCCGALIYGKVWGSLLAGNWQADYEQLNQFGGGRIATHFEDFRVTPVLDAELGAGWVSRSGRLKLTAGYLFNNWFNTISNRDYIRNVRSGQLLDLTDVLTFSGLTSRLELRF